jgi:metal-responsive CopG/Arc/MetJ family transcriptional regulator
VKVAISIPDELFDRAEKSAARRGMNRSQLYAKALDSFLADEEHDPVTEALDEIAAEADTGAAVNAGRDLIASGRWEW